MYQPISFRHPHQFSAVTPCFSPIRDSPQFFSRKTPQREKGKTARGGHLQDKKRPLFLSKSVALFSPSSGDRYDVPRCGDPSEVGRTHRVVGSLENEYRCEKSWNPRTRTAAVLQKRVKETNSATESVWITLNSDRKVKLI
ncbi:hypothetical protein AVEN_107344-1 [Araneus ventricosus]|uniref:Uncharacterized protein n=1 Tax=Araneus ventricosus TaxID=182803 RepID=A0A4Y2HRX2_ARAVE|nr:hypothetical protein AVEN_107344-1 [Araneus ventricosus]